MKILRAVARRGATVGIAGYFNVLRSNTWFAASHLPDKPYLIGQIKTSEGPESQGATIPPQILRLDAPDRRLIRLALIVLAAAAITFVALWCIGH